MGPPAAEIPVGVNLTEWAESRRRRAGCYADTSTSTQRNQRSSELRPLPSFRGQSHSVPLTTHRKTDFTSEEVSSG